MIKFVLNQSSRIVKRSWNSRAIASSTMRYLTQNEAILVDVKLFNEFKFSVDQLMELAGLSCSHAVAKTYPVSCLNSNRVLVCCGPGNNGGDGLVCARHLSLMGYSPVIYYPKRPNNTLYQNLTRQCELMDIGFMEDAAPTAQEMNKFSVIVDALFGFSFKPPIREPFIQTMQELALTTTPIASIDIPSGWDVENGPAENNKSIHPDLLISLTAPKLCSRFFNGTHYLGGRFVPKSLEAEYNLSLPEYPGCETIVKIE